jgi:hypothetical protein
MPQATLTFDLNDSEDRMAHLRAVQSIDMAIALFHILYNSKKEMENKTGLDLDEVWEHLHQICADNNVNIDKLIV